MALRQRHEAASHRHVGLDQHSRASADYCVVGTQPTNWIESIHGLTVALGRCQGALRMHVGGAAVQSNAPPNPAVDLVALKQELERFYARHNPEKLGNVPQVPLLDNPSGSPHSLPLPFGLERRSRCGGGVAEHLRWGSWVQGTPIPLIPSGLKAVALGAPTDPPAPRQIVSSFAQRGATTAEYEYLSADLRTRYGADLSSVRQVLLPT